MGPILQCELEEDDGEGVKLMVGERPNSQKTLLDVGPPKHPGMRVNNNSNNGDARLTCRLGLQTASIAALVTIITFCVLQRVGPSTSHVRASYKPQGLVVPDDNNIQQIGVMPSPPQPSLPDLPEESPLLPEIDLIVRTTSSDLPFLLIMLESVKHFLADSIRGQMFVVFDEESPADHEAASALPDWVTVVYEPPPSIIFPQIYGAGMHAQDKIAGWTRSQWSNFYSDRYGSSPLIGILDADIVMKGFCAEKLSFFDETQGRPRMFCSQHRDIGMPQTRLIDPAFNRLRPWSCMESFPFVFQRSDFPRVREWLAKSLTAPALMRHSGSC